MSFKIHLVIIALIIAVMYFIWHTLDKMPLTVAVQAPVVQETEYSISISHASWGLACKNRYHIQNPGTASTNSAFMDSQNDKLREDNALSKVSTLCNGQMECTVAVNAATLGEDPAPTCGDKTLQVEYRCFSYDHPWNAQAPTGGKLTIDCNHSGS